MLRMVTLGAIALAGTTVGVAELAGLSWGPSFGVALVAVLLVAIVLRSMQMDA